MDTYEKKYNEALERAKKLLLGNEHSNTIHSYFEHIFPELRESEDERIRKFLITITENLSAPNFKEVDRKRVLAWLEKQKDINCLACDQHLKGYLAGRKVTEEEKQKENPKSAVSIPEDCVSSAKCEDRWHKTANSLPDNGRDVLAKDALGNYLLASFDGAQWFVSVYDGQDHPVLHTPPILEWCDIPSEKQNEQSLRDFIDDFPYSDEQEEQKPAEWSEEDKDMLHCCILSIDEAKEASRKINGKLACYDEEIAWLKSLRPSWKPSEEQMEALREVAYSLVGTGTQTDVYLVQLYEQLKSIY